ncbi:hypothetical protein HYFRA_00000769 [Hymenoscyphus fraxineus]|uniref:Uncharacterized protein n=1 Tax=Hymenoscyphus fraxineus TaxID=746836 RepID=A0A9N9KST1_9HELO|nr:hypothetical protein HYFRA_00000769 [Hymenoscyphus fraxineus]
MNSNSRGPSYATNELKDRTLQWRYRVDWTITLFLVYRGRVTTSVALPYATAEAGILGLDWTGLGREGMVW